ncbi:MAG: aminotransferase class III-fold pyridoxal phosphate-dependent enzyme [Pseudomonadota bacterium]
MSAVAVTNSQIEADYRARTPGSAARIDHARSIFPSGLVHDSRKLNPYPIYVDRAAGPRKWDVDGNEYIDFYGGHGALLLGHAHPRMLEATQTQLALGTHYGACHDLEVGWGERVQSLVPCAERVRFTSSGTEANLMAIRLARAHTGRMRLMRFKGHFHGWQDHVAFGVDSHYDGTPSPGVLSGIAEHVVLGDSSDIEGTVALLRETDDIAAVILEPTGGSFSGLPMDAAMLPALREVTRERGIVLIFDEVVTGFRVSSGGAQGYYGVTPDMATFAKIVAGGLPGGCVTGSQAIMEHLDFEVCAEKNREKVGHQGTYNANPVCAASGIAALDALVAENACERASAQAARLRDGANRLFTERALPWACYGTHSAFYFYTNPHEPDLKADEFDPLACEVTAVKAVAKLPVTNKLRLALMIEGVDMSGKPGGLVSAVHTDADIDATVAALGRALDRLQAEGEV